MNILKGVLNIFYPPLCSVCSRSLIEGETYICTHCYADIPRTNFHRHPQNIAEEIFRAKLEVLEVYSWFHFTKHGNYAKLIYTLKYKGGERLAQYLGAQYAKELKGDGVDLNFNYIVPVPLHPKRKAKRGYNQSEMIAKGIATQIKAQVKTDILHKTSYTKTQTRLSRFNRWQNIKDTFVAELNNPEEATKKILIVDDVMTTGSTILACVEALTKVGYNNISILTLAYATPN